jgi:hypothetical protein
LVLASRFVFRFRFVGDSRVPANQNGWNVEPELNAEPEQEQRSEKAEARTMQLLHRGRPVFLILAAANGAAGLAGPQSFLYVALGCFLAWLGSIFFESA